MTTKPSVSILCLVLHGLPRGRDLELGRDADTGGQVHYAVEMTRALGGLPDVARTELLTRRIVADHLPEDYGMPSERLTRTARIVRLPFGPGGYLRKEDMWPHLDEFVERCDEYLDSAGWTPDAIWSHYADAGYVGARLSHSCGVPHVFSVHSMGKAKLESLLAAGWERDAIEERFAIGPRIAVEEDVIAHADLIVASSEHEQSELERRYAGFDPQRSVVVSPGIDRRRFRPPHAGWAPSRRVRGLLDRFLVRPQRPPIVTVCRPDPAKNIEGLIETFGQTPGLRDAANLIILAGQRDDIAQLDTVRREVLERALLAIDRHDLHGHVALPKQHRRSDVSELLRLAAKRRGLFVLPSLNETFGLTLLEAAACGVPVVATNTGGPVEIVTTCSNGVLVNPQDRAELGRALADALGDRRRWKQWSRRGREAVGLDHSWSSCAARSVDAINAAVLAHRPGGALARLRPPTRRRFGREVEWAVACDIDGTLTGDDAAAASLSGWLRERRDTIAFMVATGRQPFDEARRIVDDLGFTTPDCFITAVGAEIRTGPDARLQDEWRRQLSSAGWDRPAVAAALVDVPGLVPQPMRAQGPLKLSFTVAPRASREIADAVRATLTARGLVARIEVSGGTNLDVLPPDASKGNAVRHCASLLGVPLTRVIAAGDSGNDATMLSGVSRGILVANHTSELDTLRERPNVYCSTQQFAAGVLEGLEHHLADATAVEAREPVAAGVS